ncbi:hypothetical protein F5X99DRAFT_404101 [Biscogniauxia marginata]|nr:hypothetical protein F5X99DRAFT_404101 [Biscogniauxia marginata]
MTEQTEQHHHHQQQQQRPPRSSSSESTSEGTPVPIGPDGLTPFERVEKQRAEAVDRVAADDTLDEAAKIEAIAKIRGWFLGDTAAVDAFLAGEADAAATVERLAAPIDEAYSTADHGVALYREEQVARTQRKYHSPVTALEMWGPEQDFPPPTPETESLPSTEGQLWELWYGVLHAAKRIPWRDAAQQDKLVSLVRALKSRPDPAPPRPLTVPLGRNWIWERRGALWSVLLLLGPSARECWNDACGSGAGWTAPERAAWANVNAFAARLAAAGVADLSAYAVWALGDALEAADRAAQLRLQLQTYLTVAAVWVQIAGAYMYGKRPAAGREADAGLGAGVHVGLDAAEEELPWRRGGGDEVRFCTARWDFWRRKFDREARNEELSEEVRELCAQSAATISRLLTR